MGLLDFGKKKLPKAPDLSFLGDTKAFDFLRDRVGTGLDDPTERLFADYLSSIQAPSSVDEVTRSIESDLLRQTLTDIDLDTDRALAETRSEAYDRGIGGAGIASEIEFSGLGGIRSEGAKRKSGARTTLALSELDRQKEKERAVREAYGTRYGTGANIYSQLLGLESDREKALADIINSRDLGRAGQATSIFGTQTEATLQNKGILEDIMRNVKIGFNFGG